jgi:ectoine hydroxylase-related dioxygenase (phytanoyl-CoA dioxygenase family)
MSVNTFKTQRSQLYHEEGYHIERGLLSAPEINDLISTFMALNEKRKAEFYINEEKQPTGDPLAEYPRVMFPHRYHDLAKKTLLHPKIFDIMEEFYEEPMLAAQSMFYFKPPKGRGQALHQDNFYLKVSPGSCVAAWIALDRADPENGGLKVVPKTHRSEIYCPEPADLNQSWTNHLVKPPPGTSVIAPVLEPGDVLFFNGSLIHGSDPNNSETRFRRSFIGHYVSESCLELAKYCQPLLDRNAKEFGRNDAVGGGPCGTDIELVH